MGWFSNNKDFLNTRKSNIRWIELTSISQLQDLLIEKDKIFVIFKHSTRCSISKMGLNRFQEEWNISDNNVVPLYLDLLSHRDISDFIEEFLEVRHESPQVIVVKKESALFHASHSSISFLKIDRLISDSK